MKQDILVIVGPTASGKTGLSLQLAKQLHGEIVSGDSMQIYREMDIGTAKVSLAERMEIPHHLVDICTPDRPFSVEQFQQLANRAIESIHERRRLPLLVGGTGLYIEAVIHGYQMPMIAEDPQYRASLEEYAQQNGNDRLHRILAHVDAETAARIHPNNRRRVIRALEVYKQTGVPFSMQTARQKSHYPNATWIGLTMPRELLYQRIDQRVDQMLDEGWLEEVATLREKYSLSATALKAIGYRELMQVLDGTLSLAQATEQIKQSTRKYAKRQLTWFRRISEIHWFDISQQQEIEEVTRWVAANIKRTFFTQ